MRRRRSSSASALAASSGSQSQSARPDFGELVRLLGIAAEANRSDEINALAAQGVDLSSSFGSGGLSALHRATLTGSMDALRTLLDAGARTDTVDAIGRRTALHFAALRSHAEAVEILVASRANLEARDLDGRTPLHLSCIVRPSDPTVPLYLLGVGAFASATDAQGTTVLDIAVRYGCAEVVLAIFREAGRRPRPSRANRRLLYQAVRGGDARIVGCLVSNGWETGVPVATPPPPVPWPLENKLEQSSPQSPSSPRTGHTRSAPTPASAAGTALFSAAAAAADFPASATVAAGETLSPLMLAADSGRVDVVRALLRGRQAGYPNAGDTRGYTALHFATMRGSARIAEALLGLPAGVGNAEQEGGRNVDGGGVSSAATPTLTADPDAKNADGDTALHISVATRRTNVGEVLLRAGASVGIANSLGHTALHFAAALGFSGFAKELLDRGADVAAVDGVDSAGTAAAPAHKAGKARRGSTGTARGKGVAKAAAATTVACRRSGATLPPPPGARVTKERRLKVAAAAATATPLASLKPRPNKRKFSLCGRTNTRRAGGGGAKIGGRSNNGGGEVGKGRKREGRTPLHYAAMNGRVETVRVLLEAGAPPAHRWNRKRESPLHVAARNGHAGVVGLLLKGLGPGDVDAPTVAGETPLSLACANGHADVVDQLLRKGADVFRRNALSHQLSLDNAVLGPGPPSGRVRIVKTLLEAKANPDGEGGMGAHSNSTPLHTACRDVSGSGRRLVEALLEGGANADAVPPGNGGKRLLRPLHIAAVHGNAEAVSALTLWGCRLDVKTVDPSRSTPLVLAVQQGHLEAARALIEAGAAIDVIPRGQDGQERAPSLARLAADMRRGDMVSLLARAVVERDASETWVRDWAAATGYSAGASGASLAANAAAAVAATKATAALQGVVVGAEAGSG